MKILIAMLLIVGGAACLSAQNGRVNPSKPLLTQADGILQSVNNASLHVSATDGKLELTRGNAEAPMELVFANCQGLGIRREDDQWWVLPLSAAIDKVGAQIDANSALWVLPLDALSKDSSWHLELHGGEAIATATETGLRVTLQADRVTLSKAEARPHSDPFGHRFSFKIAGSPELEDALAAFYWGTMLPSVVEKTMAARFPYSSGYVLSTLNVKSYAGSYPAVDHEFQIKGRLAMGSEADLDVVKRMIGLQFQLMKDDPEGLFRAPCSVQPDGRREYHIRRNSKDNRENAAMFLVTGNIEVVEEAWHYYEARKDRTWLKENIGNLENAAGWTLANVDQYGRLWGDVYYEDQVIKDGRVTQAQGFAARSFTLLAGMERVLGRGEKAAVYEGVSKKMSDVLIAPLPMGYWDEAKQRFIDWVDRDGKVHDHVPLVANTLPVTLGYATKNQADAVRRLVAGNAGQFERFPSFLSADIAGYTKSEIGSGGPYDLSAAGRYWYWDAAFRQSEKQGGMLFDQLKAVAAEGAKHGYFMGERYDMDYVYYVDGKNSHGAEKYYEYPNVFAAVLISKYLGLTIPADADVAVAPRMQGKGSVEFGIPEYSVSYSCDESGFALKNLSGKQRKFKVDLSGLSDGAKRYRLQGKAAGGGVVGAQSTIVLAAGEEARWVAERDAK
ncbi:MAG TPA: hypothetical protein VHZ52_13620 [Acidobacteriaceae bacterium]|nr:hypothetical protein [Acidobacteriaceae bacterium]